MNCFALRSLTLLVALLLALPDRAPLLAKQPSFAPQDHAWARFEPGAWKKVRVVTETLDPQGNITSTSTTDTTSMLENVTDVEYQLQVNVTVEVAGRKFDAEPQTYVRGLLGETEGQSSIFKNSSATTVTIEGKEIPCEVYTVEVGDDQKKRSTKIYYARNFSPAVLRKESVTTDAAGETVLDETVESVVAVNMPYKVLNEIMTTWHVRTVRTHPKGKTITLAVYSDAVPGGAVSHSSKELDSRGRLVRRSTLELVDYGLEPDRRVFLRLHPFKRKASRRR